MKTFFEYVTTPGRPASRSPASRMSPAIRSRSSSIGPRAASSALASPASSARPVAARPSARRMLASVGSGSLRSTIRPA
ncbi:hypothetical protein V2I01_19935 [Micromonospora sp. BRA006-A]|nr:hypothetical protein [Micromonospora sp. BRA006-A]